MNDLIGFKCQVAVDDLANIPESLSITMGDLILLVPVQLEITTPFGEEDQGIPFAGGNPNKEGDQMDPLDRQLARKVNLRGGNDADNTSTHADDTKHSETWNSSKIRERKHANSPGFPGIRRPPSTSGGGADWSSIRVELALPLYPPDVDSISRELRRGGNSSKAVAFTQQVLGLFGRGQGTSSGKVSNATVDSGYRRRAEKGKVAHFLAKEKVEDPRTVVPSSRASLFHRSGNLSTILFSVATEAGGESSRVEVSKASRAWSCAEMQFAFSWVCINFDPAKSSGPMSQLKLNRLQSTGFHLSLWVLNTIGLL